MKITNHQIKLTVLALFSILTFFAQESFSAKVKGTYFTSGSILVHSTTHKINDNKSTSFTTAFTPKAGYFIKENLAVGAELTLKTSNATVSDFLGDSTTKTTGFAFAPFARYYFDNGLFAEGLAGIGSQKTTIEGGFLDSSIKSSTFGFRVTAGYSLFLGSHVAIEPTVNYSSEKISPKNAPSNYKENLSSIFLGIGISAYF